MITPKENKFIIHDANRLKTMDDHILIKKVTVNDNLLSKLPIYTHLFIVTAMNCNKYITHCLYLISTIDTNMIFPVMLYN